MVEDIMTAQETKEILEEQFLILIDSFEDKYPSVDRFEKVEAVTRQYFKFDFDPTLKDIRPLSPGGQHHAIHNLLNIFIKIFQNRHLFRPEKDRSLHYQWTLDSLKEIYAEE